MALGWVRPNHHNFSNVHYTIFSWREPKAGPYSWDFSSHASASERITSNVGPHLPEGTGTLPYYTPICIDINPTKLIIFPLPAGLPQVLRNCRIIYNSLSLPEPASEWVSRWPYPLPPLPFRTVLDKYHTTHSRIRGKGRELSSWGSVLQIQIACCCPKSTSLPPSPLQWCMSGAHNLAAVWVGLETIYSVVVFPLSVRFERGRLTPSLSHPGRK